MVKALSAVPAVLARLDLSVGHSETFALLHRRLSTSAAPAPAPEPQPEPTKSVDPEPAPEAPQPTPVIAGRRPGYVRPPAQTLAVTTDAIVQAAAATAAPQRPRQSQDELAALLAAVGSVAAESQAGEEEDEDVIPDAYVEPTITEEEALREPGEVALADEPVTDDPWVNPLRIGLPKPPRPLTVPTGVIVPLVKSSPPPVEDDDELPDWVTSTGPANPNDKSLIARLSAERSAKRRLTS
jgi:hypothetical protein